MISCSLVLVLLVPSVSSIFVADILLPPRHCPFALCLLCLLLLHVLLYAMWLQLSFLIFISGFYFCRYYLRCYFYPYSWFSCFIFLLSLTYMSVFKWLSRAFTFFSILRLFRLLDILKCSPFCFFIFLNSTVAFFICCFCFTLLLFLRVLPFLHWVCFLLIVPLLLLAFLASYFIIAFVAIFYILYLF